MADEARSMLPQVRPVVVWLAAHCHHWHDAAVAAGHHRQNHRRIHCCHIYVVVLLTRLPPARCFLGAGGCVGREGPLRVTTNEGYSPDDAGGNWIANWCGLSEPQTRALACFCNARPHRVLFALPCNTEALTEIPSSTQMHESESDEVDVALNLMREQRTTTGDNVKALCHITCSREDMTIYMEIAKKLASLRCADGSVPIAGLCAPAGGGKSTLVQILRLILEQVLHIGQVVEVSLDDFLSSQQERKERHIRTRWDVNATNADLGASCLYALKHAKAEDSIIELPSFSKGRDERVAEPRIVHGKVALVIFEGWRVGVDHPNFEPFNTPIDLLMYLRVDLDAIVSFKCVAAINPAPTPAALALALSLTCTRHAGTSAQSGTSKSVATTCTHSMAALTKSAVATTAAWLKITYCRWRAGAIWCSKRMPSIT